MKRKKNLLMLLIIVVMSTKAQSPFPSPYVVQNVDWIKYYSQADLIYNAPTAIDANSNVYTTGYAGGGSIKDLLSLKYDSTGALIYNYQYDNGGIDIGNAIKIDASGNAYIAGMSEDPGSTGKDYVIIKLSPTGGLSWSNVTRFDGSAGGGVDEATAICVDASGDIYCTGKSQNSNGDFDIVTLKIDGSNGSIIWQHTYNGTSNLDDVGTAMVLSSDGQQVFVTGYSTETSNGKDIVTYALDVTTGSYNWSPSVIITNGPSSGDDVSNAIILAGANIVICGEVDNTSNGTGMDFTTIKYDGTSGAILWQQDYDKYGAGERATSLARDSTGNIGVIGTSDNGGFYEYHTVLYDSTGVMYGSNIESTGLASLSVNPKICNDTIAHHWYCSGEIMKATKDIFVYQLSPSATTAWRQIIDGQNSDVDGATGVAVNGVGVVYVCALSKNSMADFDYTTIKLNQTPLYWPPDFNGETVNNRHLYLKNHGQILRTDTTLANEVLYYTHNTSPEIFIEQDAFNFVFSKVDTSASVLDSIERIQYKFLNANSYANLHEYLPKLTKYNYYLGYALSNQIEDVQGNERIFIPNFYPYVDLHYFSCKGGIKYYLVAKPGALIDEIMMQIDGEVTTAIDATNGQLSINGQLGSVLLEKPIAYTVNWLGQVVPITSGSASWNNTGSNTYNIIAPTGYNPAMPLIIQVSAAPAAVPSVNHANLDYSTYYGGSGNERFYDIKVAANGDRHVTGYTDANTFPVFNIFQFFYGQNDAVFLKYTADDTLRYATFIGGIDPDFGNSIVVNSNNEVFVGGQTSSTDFPVQPLSGASNQTQNGFSGGGISKQDGFLFKYIPSNMVGQRLVWSRFIGGSREEAINSICVDGSGNLYFAGWSGSPYLPTVNAYQSTMGTWQYSTNKDAIFGKLNSALTMQWFTYYGSSSGSSSSEEEATDIVVDNNGNVIGCGFAYTGSLGRANSTGNNNVFFDLFKGPQDGFLIRFNSSGVPDYRTYFGGDGFDRIMRLEHDPITNDVYFAGESNSSVNFPFHAKTGATNSQFQASRNAFVGYMSGNLTKQWCTYYGKGLNKTYNVRSLSVDNDGLVYLGGYTQTDSLEYPASYPTTVVYKDSVLNGTEDGFLAIYSPLKTLYNSHYFGGDLADRINNSDIGQNQKLWTVGNTNSNQTSFPIAYSSINAAEIDSTYNGGQDGFISSFDLENYQVTEIKEYQYDKSVLTVYPNPSSSNFYIEMDENYKNNSQIKIYNITGKLIYDQKVTSSISQINCESWANGVYLITVNNNSAYTSFKFIKN